MIYNAFVKKKTINAIIGTARKNRRKGFQASEQLSVGYVELERGKFHTNC